MSVKYNADTLFSEAEDMYHKPAGRAAIAVIGGGTGSFTVLQGLRNYTDNITALVSMSDDGGSTGVLRDELGVLPPGDVRQALVALSHDQDVRELFNYRFPKGDSLEGHNLGNLVLSGLELMTGSFEEGIARTAALLKVRGRVAPISTDDHNLVLTEKSGHTVTGEHAIATMRLTDRLPQLHLSPNATITDSARKAIMQADVVVIAPGNLYGSLAPALLVDGVGACLAKTGATVVSVANLVNKPGQTDDYMVHDHVSELERLAGAEFVDIVLFNTDEPDKNLVKKYLRDGEAPVAFDLEELHTTHYRHIGTPLVARGDVTYDASDKIAQTRTLIRHDSDLLARKIMGIYFDK